MKYKIDLKKAIIVSLIFATLDAMWTLYGSYIPIYLQAGSATFAAGVGVLGFGFTPAITGLILSLGNAISMVLRPLVGVFSDTSKSKMGRRMPFVVFGMPFMVIALIAVSYIPELIPQTLNGNAAQLTGYLVPFFIALAVILIAYPVMLGPGRVMLFDVIPSEHRVTANGVSQTVDGFLCIVVIVGGAMLYDLYRPLPMWVSAAFIFAAVLLVWKTVKEPSVVDPSSPEKSASFKEILHTLRTLPKEDTKSLVFFSLALLFALLGLAVGTSFVTSYAVSVLGVSVGTASMLMVIIAITCMVVAVPAAMLANRFGRKNIMLVGAVICVLSCLLIWLLGSLVALFIIMVTFSIGFMFIVISTTPMAADLSPSEKYIGTYVSLTHLVGSLGPVLGPVAGGWLVGMFNNNYAVIWPALAVIFVLTFLSLLPITKGEAKKEIIEDQPVSVAGVS